MYRIGRNGLRWYCVLLEREHRLRVIAPVLYRTEPNDTCPDTCADTRTNPDTIAVAERFVH